MQRSNWRPRGGRRCQFDKDHQRAEIVYGFMISNDPTRPEFWDNRFVAGKTPWDLHGVPQGLNAYLSRSTPGRVLIPGCGSAYEVRAFSDAGWSVTAIDFSPAAVARAKKLLGSLSDLVVLGDFFKHPFGE